MFLRLNRISLLESYSSTFILVIIFFGCAAHIDNNKEINLAVEIKNVEVWVDLMPGSQHYFYITANGNLANTSFCTLKHLKVEKATIYQDAKPIANFDPFVKWTDSTSSEIICNDTLQNLDKNGKAEFSFKNRLNYIPQNILNQNEPINILLHFSSDNGNFYFWIREIKIEKVF
jgi:hypothetical protein